MGDDSTLVKFSNTTLVRDDAGELSVWVAGEKILGATQIQVNPSGVLVFAVPMERVRMAEGTPIVQLVYETKNILPFMKPVVVDTPQTDGDSA